MKVINKTFYFLDEKDRKSIKKQMIDLDLNLTKLSNNIGISTSYLCDVINGKRHFTNKIKNLFENVGIIL